MSSAATVTKPSTPFLWVFGAFTSFAILLAFLLNLADPALSDPRESERLANKDEIAKAQADLLAKLGVNSTGTRDQIISKTVEYFASKKSAASSQVVPGSSTQLKQISTTGSSVTAGSKPTADSVKN